MRPRWKNHTFGAHSLDNSIPLVCEELLTSPEVHRDRSRLMSATAIQSPSYHQKYFYLRIFTFFYFHRALFVGLRESRNII